MVGVFIVAALLIVVQSPADKVPTVAVFLGPIPSSEGFVATAPGFDDSYRDLREEFRKNKSFQQVIRLVDSPDEAELIIEITGRGLTDSGIRTGSATATSGTTAVGTSIPVLEKRLRARLAVQSSDYRLEIDGAAGLRRITFRNQAKNVLQQVVDWVKANRSKLRAA